MTARIWLLKGASLVIISLKAFASGSVTPEQQPRLSVFANGSSFEYIYQGWPLLMQARLMHPKLLRFESTDMPTTIVAPTGGPWSNALSIEVRNALGELQDWAPAADSRGLENVLTLDSVTSGYVGWILSPGRSSQILPGEYSVEALLDTRTSSHPTGWKGLVRSSPAIVRIESASQPLTSEDESYGSQLLASHALWLNDTTGALERLDSLLLRQPDNIGALEMKADLLDMSGKVMGAFQAYQDALQEFRLQWPNPAKPPRSLMRKRSLLLSETDIPVGVVSESAPLPIVAGLFQNYPNPFNPATVIGFQIPDRRLVNLKVYDVLGRVLAYLVNDILPPGEHRIEWNAESHPSGVYFYQLITEEYTETKKMLLLK